MFDWVNNIFAKHPPEERKLELPPSYEKFKNYTKLLEDKLPGLGIEIKGYEEKLEKVKAEYCNNAKKKNELENKLDLESKSLAVEALLANTATFTFSLNMI